MKLHELFETTAMVESFLMEMASFRPNSTGIDRVVIWMGPKQAGAAKHGPRIKVSASYTNNIQPDDLFVMTVNTNPTIVAGTPNLSSETIEDIKDWIRVNYQVLIAFWDYQIDDEQVKQMIKKV